MKNWKKRWFVLGDGKLYYYKTEVKRCTCTKQFWHSLELYNLNSSQEKIEVTDLNSHDIS